MLQIGYLEFIFNSKIKFENLNLGLENKKKS